MRADPATERTHTVPTVTCSERMKAGVRDGIDREQLDTLVLIQDALLLQEAQSKGCNSDQLMCLADCTSLCRARARARELARVE